MHVRMEQETKLLKFLAVLAVFVVIATCMSGRDLVTTLFNTHATDPHKALCDEARRPHDGTGDQSDENVVAP